MLDKFKYLFKNTSLLVLSNFSSKILVFLLVPFYTSILTTSEYGIYDLFYSTIQLLMPILSLNTVDSVLRFSIDSSKNEKMHAFTLGIKCFLLSTVLILIGSLLFLCFIKDSSFNIFWGYFILLFISYSLNNIILQFSRGIDDISGIAIAGVMGTVGMIVFNVLFLLILQLSLEGYFLAMIISLVIPSFFLIFRDRLWRYVIFDKNYILNISDQEKKMLKYCLPLMFINVSWYINNVSDRYAIIWLCGINASGVYSVAYKIPAMLNSVQTVFIQAWQLSAVKEYHKSDVERFYSMTYFGCQAIMCILCSGLIISVKFLSKLLFLNEFYSAWVYVPFLLIYIVFNTLSGTIGGIFSATKDTKKLAYSSIIGAFVNLILNFVLVFFMGPIGAAISTLLSSWIIWRIRMKSLSRHINLTLNIKYHYAQYFSLILQSIGLLLIDNIIICYSLQVLLFIFIVTFVLLDYTKMRKRCCL